MAGRRRTALFSDEIGLARLLNVAEEDKSKDGQASAFCMIISLFAHAIRRVTSCLSCREGFRISHQYLGQNPLL